MRSYKDRKFGNIDIIKANNRTVINFVMSTENTDNGINNKIIRVANDFLICNSDFNYSLYQYCQSNNLPDNNIDADIIRLVIINRTK
jgi:hypothetical protein